MKTLDDWPRVKRVLEEALACEDADRQAYLAETCGDRQRVARAGRKVARLDAIAQRVSWRLRQPCCSISRA